jgi:hypothetical protein
MPRDPPGSQKTPFSGFPSTGPLCGAFNRCIFLLRDFETAEMLSISPLFGLKNSVNYTFFRILQIGIFPGNLKIEKNDIAFLAGNRISSSF